MLNYKIEDFELEYTSGCFSRISDLEEIDLHMPLLVSIRLRGKSIDIRQRPRFLEDIQCLFDNLKWLVSEQDRLNFLANYLLGIKQVTSLDRRFKFLYKIGDTAKSIYTFYEYKPVGQWSERLEGPIIECKSGFYASNIADVLIWATKFGNVSGWPLKFCLFEVELKEEVAFDTKVAGRSIKLVKEIGTWETLTDSGANLLKGNGNPSSPFYLESLILELVARGESR